MSTIQNNNHPLVLPSVRAISLGMAIVLFIILCVLPIIYMLGISLTYDNGISIQNYRRLFIEPRQQALLITSALLGAGAAALATVIGVPLGIILARVEIPAKRLLRLALVTPLVIPPYIMALAWIYIGGSAGLVAQLVGTDLLSSWTYSLAGAIVVLGISFYPLAMLTTEAAARRVDARLEEAALLVAPPSQVLWKITLPLMLPAIATATLTIFVLTLAEFGVAGLLRVPVFTTEIFTAFSALYDFAAATALAFPLLVVTLIMGFAVKLLIGDRLLTTRRSLQTGLMLSLGFKRPLTVVYLLLTIFITVFLPIMVLSYEASGITHIIYSLKTSINAIKNSLVLSSIAATLTILIALLLGYWREHTQHRLGDLMDLLFIVVFAVPSTVVGVGLIGLWNRPGWLGTIYTSQLIIIFAYLARFLPIATLMIAANIRQVPHSFEEAAEISGASWPRTFTHILIPQIRTGLAAAWVISFIFTFSEIGATVLVAPPGESTLPVRIYTLIANAPSREVAALALLQVGIVITPFTLFGLINWKKGEQS
ncbi:MAG: iron ABC transporter permease [Acidobacteriota bacterium]